MVGLDTNVLVRHLVQDDETQAKLARELIEGRCRATEPGHITLIVLCELVRKRSYRFLHVGYAESAGC